MGRKKLVGDRCLSLPPQSISRFYTSPYSPGFKNPVSYSRLERKVPFGTKWLITGSRNFGKAAIQQAGPAPLLTRQLPGEHWKLAQLDATAL